jgi:hypothetical protein
LPEICEANVGIGSMLSKKGLRLATNSDSAFPTRDEVGGGS